MSLTTEREARFKNVISNRQFDLTVVLENVHDPHNIGAVMRSCDAVGIGEIYVLNSERKAKDKLFGLKSSSGSAKWIDIIYHESVDECMSEIRDKYTRIIGTHLSHDSVSLHDLELTESVALVFGNEHDGISDECLKHIDQNMIIPQFGMVQSLNISVACAITLYETLRQRMSKGKYNQRFSESNGNHSRLFKSFLEKHKTRK